MGEMNYQIDLLDGASIKLGDPYPGSDDAPKNGAEEDPRKGWTVGAIFFVEEVIESGDEEDDLGLKTPAHYLIFGGPPLDKTMSNEENAFFLKVYLSGQIKMVHCMCAWEEMMEMLVAFTGGPPAPEETPPQPQAAQPQAPTPQPQQPTAG